MNRQSAGCTWSAGIHLAAVAGLLLLSRGELLRERSLVTIDFSLREAGQSSLEPTPAEPARKEPQPKAVTPPHPQPPVPPPAARAAATPPQQAYPVAANPQEAVLPYAPPAPPQPAGHPAPAASGTVTASPKTVVRSEEPPNPAAREEEAKKRYLKEHFAYIRDVIAQRVSYPAMARKMGWQGTAVVKFVVEENGRVSDVRVEKASGFPSLDRSAVETVRDAAPFPKPPVRAEISMPVSYRLE